MVSLLCSSSFDHYFTGPSRFTPTPILPSNTAVETSRIMLPDDTNPSGNVHGGTILKLIEQAGSIVATRHCNTNSDSQDKLIAVLVRVEQMDFHQPMYVGEVSQVQAAVTFTSEHSIEVMVDVWADNVLTGQRRHTNSATLWYVAMPANLRDYQQVKPAAVPQLTDLTAEEYHRGKERYKAQKLARQEADNTRGRGGDRRKGFSKYQSFHSGQEHEQHTVAASRSTLANVVLPSDCYLSGHMMGGSLMKMMDNAAGICAVSHCRTPVVTVCLEAINFHSPVMNGEAVFVTAELVFTSAKSMEIEIRAEAEGLRSGHRVTNTARFTFVSLGKDGHAVAVPPLKLMTDEEKEKFEEGKKRYEERKRLRLEKMNKNRQ